MRKIALRLIIIVSVFALTVSCSKKERTLKDIQQDVLIPSTMVTTKADTTEVTNLVNMFIGKMRDKDVDGAMGMLYYLDKDTIRSLPEDLAKRERAVLNTFKGLEYDLDRIVFNKETDSEAKINITLFKKKQGDTRPNEVGMIIKPVRRDGTWYLTLSDTDSDTTNGTEIEN